MQRPSRPQPRLGGVAAAPPPSTAVLPPRAPPTPSSASASSSPHGVAAQSSTNIIQSASAVLHDLHVRATSVLHEAEACIADICSATLTATSKAVVPPSRKTQEAAATMLRRCCAVQAVLNLDRHDSAPDTAAAVMQLEQALTVLLAYVPADWRKQLAGLPEAALGASNAPAAARTPTHNAVTATAPSAAAGAPAGPAATPDGQGAAAPSHARKEYSTNSPAAAAAAEGLGPGDVVQLALLLRRRWTLQRDLHLLVAALRDVCAAAAAAASANASHAPRDDASPSSAAAPPPPLTVVSVALGVLQLPRTAAQLAEHPHANVLPDAHTTSTRMQDASPQLPYPVPSTVVPVWLWRACGAPGAGAPGLLPCVSVFTPTAPAAAVLDSVQAARRMTKHIFKWEARLARFASDAVVAASPEALAQQQRLPAPVMELLDAVLMDLNLERGGCNEVQLLWLAIASAVAVADAADASRLSSAHATALHAALCGADVVKRCGKVEHTLRTLWPASAVARALLPGVLLLLGGSYAARVQGPMASGGGGGGVSAASSSTAGSKQLACWTEAYMLGQQVLGATHPVVEAAAALVAAGAATRDGSAAIRMATFPNRTPSTHPCSASAGPRRDSIATTMSSCASSDPYLHFQPSAALHAAASQRLPAGTLTRPPALPPVAPQSQQQFSAMPPRPPPSAPLATTQQQVTTSTALAVPRVARPPSLLPPPFAQTVDQSASPRSPSRVSAGPPMQLARTFPVPSIASSSGGAVSDGASAAKAAASLSHNDAAVSQLSVPRRTAPQPGGKVSGRDALRRCYRLQNPADAFVLRSAVKDASPQASEGADGEKKKKKKKTGAARGDRDGKSQPSTAALLLSAISPTATAGGPNGSPRDADGSGGGGRRTKKDRKLLLLSSPERAASAASRSKRERGGGDGGGAASVQGAAASAASQPQQQQLRKADGDGPPSDLGATAQGLPASVMQEAGNESGSSPAAERRLSAIAPSPNGPAAPVRAGSGSSGSHPSPMGQSGEVGARARIGSGSAARGSLDSGDGEEDEEEDEEDDDAEEEEEDDETLPERSARFQREVIGFYAELNERRARAALVIQLAWRSSKAREELHLRRQVLYRYMHTIQKAAALAIDGFFAGVREQRRRRAALQVRANADERRRQRELREVAAAQTLTRAVRQWLVRQEERRRLCKELSLAHDARLRLYASTAVTVQRWWRRIVVQKAYWRRRTIEVAEQLRLEADAARQADAATCIQRHVRGMLTRTMFWELRERRRAEAATLLHRRHAAITVLTIVLQEYTQRQLRQSREAAELEACEAEAATRLAESWRHTMERRRLDLALTRARELSVAATRLQRAWRRHAAGRQRRYLREMRKTVQVERLVSEARTYEVARLLQCYARSAMDQLLVRRLKARHGRTFMENVIFLQSIGRGILGRVTAGRMWAEEQDRQRAAAAALAALQLRAMHLAQSLLRARASATLVQTRRRRLLTEKLMVSTTAAREMREEAAATVLQRAERRRQQRVRDAAAAEEAAIALAFLGSMAQRVQRTWRCWRARQARRDLAAAVAHCARKRMEREEVWRLIWQDQLRELEVTCHLERQFIAELQHQGRVRLYALLCNPNAAKVGRGEVESYGEVFDEDDYASAAHRPDAEVLRWAALYDE